MSSFNNNICCTPARPDKKTIIPFKIKNSEKQFNKNAIVIPGGNSIIGTNSPIIPEDGEGPIRKIKINPYKISETTVTNAEFRSFVDETKYLTDAESFGWSFVFWKQIPNNVEVTLGVSGANWWRRVDGACWHAPNGPKTQENCLPDHPVVHISWNDAIAYANWAGGRLPSEGEWEHAARAGQGDVLFPWGNTEPDDDFFTPCNIWQGQFPDTNTAKDGFLTTAPVRSFSPNSWGIHNMVGNVWEWTNDAFKLGHLDNSDKENIPSFESYKIFKGGSFVCHRSYCYRYRIAARSGASPESSSSHYGFRVVWPS